MQCQKLRTYMETGRVVFLPVRAIQPNPDQPRKVFRREALEELAESIRTHGILQPLSVRRVEGNYRLIAGERRLRAAQLAGLTEIPCILMSMDDRESGMAAMVENLQRQDLDFIEEAWGISHLMSRFSMSQEQVAKLLGKSQSAVANKLRILRLDSAVLERLRSEGLSERHARALLRLEDREKQQEALDFIIDQRMNVAAAEDYIARLTAPRPEPEVKAMRRKSLFVMKDVRVFMNSLNRSLDLVRQGGIDATLSRDETESDLVLTVRIPKKK